MAQAAAVARARRSCPGNRRLYRLQAALKKLRFIAAAALVAAAILLPARAPAANEEGKINVTVDCHCPDPVGQKFCAGFKNAVETSAGYRLADSTRGYGMGVHFSCVDLWQGINDQLSGHMSLVSVAFTIYSDALPGEVYEDSSAFRVGIDAVPEMSRKILAAVGQLVSMNSGFFDRMRAAAKGSPPSTAPAGQSSAAAPK